MRYNKIIYLLLPVLALISSCNEDVKKGVDTEKDGLSNLLTQARDTMNEIPEMD